MVEHHEQAVGAAGKRGDDFGGDAGAADVRGEQQTADDRSFGCGQVECVFRVLQPEAVQRCVDQWFGEHNRADGADSLGDRHAAVARVDQAVACVVLNIQAVCAGLAAAGRGCACRHADEVASQIVGASACDAAAQLRVGAQPRCTPGTLLRRQAGHDTHRRLDAGGLHIRVADEHQPAAGLQGRGLADLDVRKVQRFEVDQAAIEAAGNLEHGQVETVVYLNRLGDVRRYRRLVHADRERNHDPLAAARTGCLREVCVGEDQALCADQRTGADTGEHLRPSRLVRLHQEHGGLARALLGGGGWLLRQRRGRKYHENGEQ